MRKITLLGALALCFAQSYGQTDCAKTLKKAQAAYDDGLLEKIPNMLTPCIQAEAFLEEDLVQAYKLMTLSYIFDDRYEKADSSMQLFLKEEPEYEINTTVDPPEFVNLYNSFRTHPLYSFGIVAGANMSFKRDKELHTVLDKENVNYSHTTRNVINYVAGLSGSYYFSKRFEANLELLAVGRNLETTEQGGGLEYRGFSESIASETQTWLETPLTFTYTMGNTKLKPYVRLGGSVGFLLFSSITFERSYIQSDNQPVQSRALDFKGQRNGMNFWAHGGLGIKYKIKNGHLMLDARYCYGLGNQTQYKERSATEISKDAEANYYYMDNDFFISNINVTLGFFQYIYSPKKLKNKKK